MHTFPTSAICNCKTAVGWNKMCYLAPICIYKNINIEEFSNLYRFALYESTRFYKYLLEFLWAVHSNFGGKKAFISSNSKPQELLAQLHRYAIPKGKVSQPRRDVCFSERERTSIVMVPSKSSKSYIYQNNIIQGFPPIFWVYCLSMKFQHSQHDSPFPPSCLSLSNLFHGITNLPVI